ncbi:unnamed protein product [Tuber aestivum]|uniref:Uncharacterized protein n=1 Tax=Tuber aestivum TaxID=59557 RepID=A0A292Q9L3_9PEZI|nr:unnamed protein product [Tuber aestivum]
MFDARVSRTPPPSLEEVQDLLKEIANLLCPGHEHQITVPYIKTGETTGYNMMIACGHEGNITWQVAMSADTRDKVIRRCKVLSATSCEGAPSMMTFDALSAWDGEQCDDILSLLRIGHLKEGWWEKNPSLLSDMRRIYGISSSPSSDICSLSLISLDYRPVCSGGGFSVDFILFLFFSFSSICYFLRTFYGEARVGRFGTRTRLLA